MNRLAAAAILLCTGGSFQVYAQGLKEKIVGVWTLVSGSENFPHGRKLVPWSTGNLILDATGHVSLFLIGKNRPTTGASVRAPIGPFVAYYGTYLVDDEKNTIHLKIERGASPLFDGATRTSTISFKNDLMVTTGPSVQTPQGMMIPVNEWKKVR